MLLLVTIKLVKKTKSSDNETSSSPGFNLQGKIAMFGYRALIIGVLVLVAVLPAQAGPLASEAIDLDRAVQRNPRKAAAEAQLLLQQTTRHDSSRYS
jgi:hypothetical protein